MLMAFLSEAKEGFVSAMTIGQTTVNRQNNASVSNDAAQGKGLRFSILRYRQGLRKMEVPMLLLVVRLNFNLLVCSMENKSKLQFIPSLAINDKDDRVAAGDTSTSSSINVGCVQGDTVH